MNTETTLIRILEDVIGVRDLGIDARFLDIGGNSLNLVKVLKQIKEKTGASLPPRMFYDKAQSTIAALSMAIDAQLVETGATASAAQ